jgi:homoserine acetyltransferase
MADPNWKNGFYYDGLPPHTGMKLARREFVHLTEQALL